MKEIQEFENWVDGVNEGTWSLPDNEADKNQLKQLFSKPLIVGPDGTNATEQLYNLIGDDELFDIIGAIAEEDPNSSLWDDLAAMKRIKQLVPWVDQSMFGKEVDEGVLDTAKKIGSKVLDKLGHGSDEDLIKDLQRKAGLPPTGKLPTQQPKEDIDTDGVMMTRQSNMSS